MISNKNILFLFNASDDFLGSRLPLLEVLKNEKFVISVGLPNFDNIDCAKYPFIEFHKFYLSRQSSDLFSQLKTIYSLLKIFVKVKPQIVFLFRVKLVLLGGLIARLRSVRMISVFTGLGYVFTNKSVKAKILKYILTCFYRVLFLNSKGYVIFQNPDDQDIFLNLKIIEKSQTLVILGSGVDVNKYQNTKEPDGIPKILLLSRMLWDKGIKEYVEAARILKMRGIEADFLLVGHTDKEAQTSVSTKELQLWSEQSTVQWYDGVQQAEVPALMAGVNIICLPSYAEGLPRVLIEGAASGRALVATDVPGCREVVKDGENGFLVPAKNSLALANALEMLILDPNKRKIMGEKSRIMAEQYFAKEKIIAEYVAIIAKISAN